MRIRYPTIFVLLVATYGMTVVASSSNVDYPSDYRSWHHTKTMIIQPGHPLEDSFGGIHHIYANPKAMSGLSDGRYGAGAVFVFDLLDYVESENVIVEAGRKRIDVMQYDDKRFPETGGWGFGSFVGDSKTERVDQDVVASCFACHTSTGSTHYVFSNYRN